jgi:polyisoprenoid-binding protein YceI
VGDVLRPLTALAALTLSSALVAADEYTIDPGSSRITVHVGKSGVFGFAGHEHEVNAPPARGRIVADPGALSASSVTVAFHAWDFHVDAQKEKGDDAPLVQETMEREVLEVDHYPDITFTSTAVKGRASAAGHYALEVTGLLALHGVSHSFTVPVEVELQAGALTARGHLSITHDAFGLKRASGGGGTVRVKNEVVIDFTLVGRAATTVH